MAKYRQNIINDAVKQEMAQILRDVKDPRIAGAFVSITGAVVTKDLKFAKAYISIMGDDNVQNDGIAALKSASGFIRREIGHRLNLRNTPEFAFELDNSIEYGAHINEIIKGL